MKHLPCLMLPAIILKACASAASITVAVQMHNAASHLFRRAGAAYLSKVKLWCLHKACLSACGPEKQPLLDAVTAL